MAYELRFMHGAGRRLQMAPCNAFNAYHSDVFRVAFKVSNFNVAFMESWKTDSESIVARKQLGENRQQTFWSVCRKIECNRKNLLKTRWAERRASSAPSTCDTTIYFYDSDGLAILPLIAHLNAFTRLVCSLCSNIYKFIGQEEDAGGWNCWQRFFPTSLRVSFDHKCLWSHLHAQQTSSCLRFSDSKQRTIINKK